MKSRELTVKRKQFRRRLRLESLEDRRLLSVTPTYVNDNWDFVDDVDMNGILSIGDEVQNNNDAIATGTITANYGMDAFGTVTSNSSGDTGSFLGSHVSYDEINDAIAGTMVGGAVNVGPGTYVENVVIDKLITLDGAGSGSNPLVDTVIQSSASGTPVITVDATGASASDRLVVRNVRVTGTTGSPGNNTSGIEIVKDDASFLTFEHLAAVNNVGDGIATDFSGISQDIKILNSELSDNGQAGLNVNSTHIVNGLTVTNTNASGNGGLGLFLEPQVSGLMVTSGSYNENGDAGLWADGLVGTTIIDGVEANDNARGIFFRVRGGTVNISDTTTIDNNNAGAFLRGWGLAIYAYPGGDNHVNITDATSTGNDGFNVLVTTSSGGDLTSAKLDDVIANGSRLTNTSGLPLGDGIGIWIRSRGLGDANGVVVRNSTSENNNRGIFVDDGADAFDSVLLENNNIAHNTTGIEVEDVATIGNNMVANNIIGVDVNGGSALLQGNDLTDNDVAGLLVQNDAVVDAGQDGSYGNFTGLGISAGGNNFSSYSNTVRVAYTDPGAAIRNLNADTGTTPIGFDSTPPDVTAQNNLFFSIDPADIETVVDHEVDDDTKGFVDFSGATPILVQNGTLFVTGGDDKDKIEIKGDQPDSGDLEVKFDGSGFKFDTTLTGVDAIVINGNGSDDDIKIKDGVAVDRIDINSGPGKDDVKIEKGVHVQGDLVVTLGAGDDKLHIKDDVAANAIVIEAGEGKDDVKLDKDVQASEIFVRAGSGDDKVEIKKGVVAHTIVAYGGDGKDDIKLDKHVSARAFLFGELGDDKIEAGGGPSVLVGGDGKDDLKGADGLNILIGGDGQDKLEGKDSDDLLIGGSTTADDDLFSLEQALGDWSTSSHFAPPPDLGIIIDDGDEDDLKGGKGNDYMVAGVGDKVKQ